MENTIYKVEHIWCADDDRWIYIEKNEQMKIIGINFMQGNAYKHFKNSWCANNPLYLNFYEEMLDIFPLEEASVTTLAFINKCMWAYNTAVSLNEQYN